MERVAPGLGTAETARIVMFLVGGKCELTFSRFSV